MLSILIPCYNFNVTDLVKDILKQAKLINIEFEIICAEDGIRDQPRSRGLGDVYKRQLLMFWGLDYQWVHRLI